MAIVTPVRRCSNSCFSIAYGYEFFYHIPLALGIATGCPCLIFVVASLPHMSICARIVVAVTLHEVDSPPNAKTCAKRDNQSLQYTNCAVKEIHINLAFCRFAAQKMLLKMKMPPLFLGGCVLVGQIYFVYVKGFIGLYDCRTGRHIPFHVKSVSFVEVGKVFVVRVFRDVVFVA